MSLKQARNRREQARTLLAREIDPSAHRKAQKAAKQEWSANSFEAVAREWFSQHSPNWGAGHAHRTLRRPEQDILPWIGSRPLTATMASTTQRIRRSDVRSRDLPGKNFAGCVPSSEFRTPVLAADHGITGRDDEGCGPLRTGSAQNLMDHAAMHIREADIPAAEAVGESLVIETE